MKKKWDWLAFWYLHIIGVSFLDIWLINLKLLQIQTQAWIVLISIFEKKKEEGVETTGSTDIFREM